MSGGWLGLIELVLVFGLVGLWCWNELRVVKRDSRAAAERERAARDTDASESSERQEG